MVNEEMQTLHEGDLVFLSLNDAHMFCDVTKTRCVRRDIMVTPEIFEQACKYIAPDLLDEMFGSGKNEIYHISANRIQRFEEKISIATVNTVSHPELAGQLMRAFLIDLINVYLRNKVNLTATNSPSWMNSIIEKFSNASLFRKNTLDILKDYSYNISYMRRAFKAQTGMTMTEYRQLRQLDYAKLLLCSTNDTIEKIAFVCGFNNATYFYRLFKKQVGIPPRSYRTNPTKQDITRRKQNTEHFGENTFDD